MDGFKLGAPFELWGQWWLPEQQEKRIPGKLSSRLGHLELNLLGHFDSIDVNVRSLIVPVIHGSAGGRPMTLWRAVQDTPSVGYSIEQNFHKLRVVVGGHFDSEADEKFSAVAMSAPQLGPLMGREPVHQKWGHDQRGIHGMRCEVVEDRSRTFGPTADGSTYRFGSSIETRREPFTSYGFDTKPSLYIEFSEPKSCAEVIGRVERTIDLLMLLVGEDVDPHTITLYVPGENQGFDFLYEFPPPEEQKLIDAREVLAPLPKLGDSFVSILERWDVERSRMVDTVNLLGDVLDRNAPSTHMRMLLLAQALEAFHRNVVGGEYLPSEDFEPIRLAMVNAIPQGMNRDHRSAIESRLKYGNELSLRTRIRKLLEGVSDDALNILQINRKVFVRDVVDARNDFTHWVHEREKSRPNGPHLANLLSSLLALTQLIVLKHLGIDEDLVVRRMQESPWRYMRRYQTIG